MSPWRARRYACAVLGTALLLPLPAASAETEADCVTPAGQRPVELCATTTIETSTTGRVRVRVPTDATLDLNPAPRITGEGRIVGFLLTEPGTTEGFWARVLRYPDILGWGIRTQADGRKAEEDREPSSGSLDPGTGWGCSACHIPPGDYDLYVIADGAPISITLELEGLDGETGLTDGDLMPAYSRQIDGFDRSGTLDTLDQATSSRTFCCAESSTAAYTFIQFATETDTDTVARASHRVCFRAEGATECDGFSSHQIVGTSTSDGLIGWHTGELGSGSYELSSSFEATNTAEGFTWEVDVVGLVLGIAPADAARAPRIFDLGGDANGLGAADVHRDSRPVSWDPADLLLVRLDTTYETLPVGDDGLHYEPTGIAIRFKTLASPDTFVRDMGAHFRLVTTIAGCPSYLLGTVYRDPDTGELSTNAYWDQHDASCPDGDMTSYSENRRPEWTASIDPERRELRLFFPFASLSAKQAEFLKVGKTLVAPRAETHAPYLSAYDSRTDTRLDLSPVLDTTLAADDFVIGSDVPQDVPCETGCP